MMNSKWKYVPFSELFEWCQKSNIGSREGNTTGKYPLYIASATEIKRYDEYLESGESLVFGTGGNPCVHYVTGNYAYTNHTEAAKKRDDSICTKFYYYYFQKDKFSLLSSTFVGGGIKNSSKKKIGVLKIPVVEKKEQEKIVNRIEEMFSELDFGVKTLEDTKEQVSIYRLSVLKEAFGGIGDYTRFGDISESRLGKMLDKEKNIGIPRKYLRNINVRWFSFDLSDLLEMKILDNEIDKYSLKKGDLVICEGGEPGRCAIWESDKTIFYQKALHRVRFSDEHNPKFYMYYLWFAAQTGLLKHYYTGTGIKHLTGQSLVKIPVPNVKLDVQNRTVNVIEEHLSTCDNIVKTIETAMAQSESMRQRILKDAFEGRL